MPLSVRRTLARNVSPNFSEGTGETEGMNLNVFSQMMNQNPERSRPRAWRISAPSHDETIVISIARRLKVFSVSFLVNLQRLSSHCSVPLNSQHLTKYISSKSLTLRSPIMIGSSTTQKRASDDRQPDASAAKRAKTDQSLSATTGDAATRAALAPIRISKSRVNNLQNFSCEIPKNALSVVTGVSGSGKSSLLWGTLHAEAQRRQMALYGPFLASRLADAAKGSTSACVDCDLVENVGFPVAVDQGRMNLTNPKSTVGTVSNVAGGLQSLFAKCSDLALRRSSGSSANAAKKPPKNSPSVAPDQDEENEPLRPCFFNVNHPEGQCKHCYGNGFSAEPDASKVVDVSKSLSGCAVLHHTFKTGARWKMLKECGLFDWELPLNQWPKGCFEVLLHGAEELGALSDKIAGVLKKEGSKTKYKRTPCKMRTHTDFLGLVRYEKEKQLALQEGYLHSAANSTKTDPETYCTKTNCTACHSTGLGEIGRSAVFSQKKLPQLLRMELVDLLGWVSHASLEKKHPPAAYPILNQISSQLRPLVDLGLFYLHLARPASTLSGGEAQRVRLASALSCSLTNVMFILDEPTAGLHASDVRKIVCALHKLRDAGNTVICVEHNPHVIQTADWIVEVGPGSGRNGGSLVSQGTVGELMQTGGATASMLKVMGKAELRTSAKTTSTISSTVSQGDEEDGLDPFFWKEAHPPYQVTAPSTFLSVKNVTAHGEEGGRRCHLVPGRKSNALKIELVDVA